MSGGVSNGQYANEDSFNDAFMARNGDTDTIGKVDLLNADAASGSTISNLQRAVNSLCSVLGITNAEVKDFIYTWASSHTGAATETFIARIEALTNRFRGGTGLGHNHSGVNGQGEKITVRDLLQYNDFWTVWQQFGPESCSGFSADVSSPMFGKVPDGGDAAAGVLTDSLRNRCELIDSASGTFVEDAEGQRVYGRITESAGVWTLTFFTLESGVETAHEIVDPMDLMVFYREVFHSSDRPTVSSNPAEFGTLDVTADVVDATATQRGLVSVNTQEFAGWKKFLDALELDSELILNEEEDAATGSDQTLAAPTAAVKILSGSGLTSIKGMAETGEALVCMILNNTGGPVELQELQGDPNQDFITGCGALTVPDGGGFLVHYDTATLAWRVVAVNVGLVVSAFSASGDNKGLSVTGNKITLHKANQAQPGGLSTDAQDIGGLKTFHAGTAHPTAAPMTVTDQLLYGAADDAATTGTDASVPDSSTILTRLTNSFLGTLGNIEGEMAGRVRILVNDTGSDVSLLNNSTGTAERRIITGTGSDVIWPNSSCAIFVYEPSSERWRLACVIPASSGGSTNVNTITFKANGLFNKQGAITAVDSNFVFPFAAKITDVILTRQIAGTSGSTEVDIQAKPPAGSWASIFSTKPALGAAAGNDATVKKGDVISNTTAPVLSTDPTLVTSGTQLRMDLSAVEVGNPNTIAAIVIYEPQ